MVITLKSEVLSTQSGILEVFYKNREEKSQLDKFSVTIEGRVTEFVLQTIWVNGQPAQHLKGFKSQKIEKSALVHYEVVKEELYLVINSQQEISLKIVFMNMNTDAKEERQLTTSLNLTVLGLKKQIQRTWNLLNDFEIYNEDGYPLSQSHKLKDCCVTENTQLIIKCKEESSTNIEKENKGKNPLEFGLAKIKFVNFKDEVHLLFNQQAPKWRTIIKGLNLEGQCQNQSCRAQNQIVCIQKGFGEFPMNVEPHEARCPICHTLVINVNNCIFWDCMYVIEGPEGFEKINKQAPQHEALSFAEGSSHDSRGNIVKWRYLKITTYKAPSNCMII